MLLIRKTAFIFACWTFILGTVSFCIAADEKKEEKPQSKLMIIDVDGKNLKELFRDEKFNAFGSPVYSPDGKHIAMDAYRGDQGETWVNAHVVTIKVDGTGLKDLGIGALPSWSADSKKIAFTQYSPNHGVWIMNTDGSNRQALDLDGWCAEWLPDGNKIAYSVNTQGGANLKIYDRKKEKTFFVFPLNKSAFSQVSFGLCWSPDSKSICFKGVTKKREYQLLTVDAKEGAQGLKVLYNNKKYQPSADVSWHPDGKQIFFVRPVDNSKEQRVYSVDSKKKDAVPTLLPGQTNKESVGSLNCSPDGKKLIFTVR